MEVSQRPQRSFWTAGMIEAIIYMLHKQADMCHSNGSMNKCVSRPQSYQSHPTWDAGATCIFDGTNLNGFYRWYCNTFECNVFGRMIMRRPELGPKDTLAHIHHTM